MINVFLVAIFYHYLILSQTDMTSILSRFTRSPAQTEAVEYIQEHVGHHLQSMTQ